MLLIAQAELAGTLSGRYSPILVALSIGVAVLASYAALSLANRVTTASGRVRAAWLAGGALALGIGMWAMHFVGMLSFRLPIAMAYRIDYLLLSLAVAIGTAAVALMVVSRAGFGRFALLAGGALVGAAFVTMHVLGMTALYTAARVTYRPELLLASVAIAVGVSLLALGLAWRPGIQDSERARQLRGIAAVGVGAAMAGMHYTAMAAARFHPAPELVAVPPGAVLATTGLAVAVIVATVSVIGVALAGALGDRYLQAQAAQLELVRASEHALRESEERHRALVTATSSIVWTTDATGTFVAPQPSWESYTGQPWAKHQGAGWTEGLHPDDREDVQAAWARAHAGGSLYESRCRLWCARTNEYRHVVSRAAPVTGPDGTVREWIGTVTDIEEQWRAEERLRQVVRMEAIGQLAGGVAHEVNNQMSVVLGCAHFMLNQSGVAPAVRQDAEYVRRAAERTAAITGQLLAFSRQQILQPRVLDLNELVRGLEPILQRTLGGSGALVLDLDSAPTWIKADPSQLEQVLLNLALNARDAMPRGGTLTIETRPVELGTAHAIGKPDVPIEPGSYAHLVVSDTGCGMDPETLSRIFEPFFTTKLLGQGTGLGLSTVYGIVKQSGGYIWPYSEPDQGTAFKVYLPLVAEERPVSTLTTNVVPRARSGETALIVEDDPLVRSIAIRALETHDYTVLETEHVANALDLLADPSNRVDVVVTDVVMPELGGRDLAARLAELRPGVPVLFISGYTDDDVVRRGLLDKGQPFLQKPFAPDDLVRRVHQLLAAVATQPGHDAA